MRVLEDGPVDAFCGWFDTQFKGSQQNPTTTEVTLTTAPDPTGATHWGQQVRGWVVWQRVGGCAGRVGGGGMGAGAQLRKEAGEAPSKGRGGCQQRWCGMASVQLCSSSPLQPRGVGSPGRRPLIRSPLWVLPPLTPSLPALPLPAQSFFLHPPVECAEGDELSCDIEVVRRRDNQRLMDVMIRHRVEGREAKDRVSCFHIE